MTMYSEVNLWVNDFVLGLRITLCRALEISTVYVSSWVSYDSGPLHE
jgi:hypothetical protein